MKKLILFMMTMMASQMALAGEIRYELSKEVSASKSMRFFIPYSAGTHEGYAKVIQGAVITDENDNVLSARFQIPIQSMRTGNETRDCHMVEALGLNYELSIFPEEHICDSNGNELPASGPDSVQYPNITVDFQEMALPSEGLVIGTPTRADVRMKFQMHGVERDQIVPVMITKSVGQDGRVGFRVISEFKQSLKNYGVIVRPVRVMGFSFGVKDTVTIQVDLSLVPQSL